MNGYHHWVLLTLLMAALPSLVRLPLWVAGIAAAGGAMHYSGRLRRGWYGKAASVLLLGAAAAGIWLSFESWFSGNAVLSFFIVVVFLKWGESRTRRDYLLLIFAAVILGAVGALYWENLLSLAHMLGVVFALTLSLVAIHMDGSIAGATFLIRRSGLLFLLGMPLMLLLFLTFPRIPGPLWDIGLAFGLPVKALMERGSGDFGKTMVLQPGGIHRATQENGNVLVAEFQGAVPFKSQMYWRGPVFWEYDGENWKLPENWNNRTELQRRSIRSPERLNRELRIKKDPWRYTLRVMPNGGRWLYGLDVPAAPAPEAMISEEFQLLSIREIDDQEPKFEMLSYLDYGVGEKLTDEQRARGLSRLENQNPRLYALGQELAAQYQDPEEVLRQALRILAGGEYKFDAAYIIPPGPDLLDRYFFDEKRGGQEYLAGSFVMLMRAAGIPARLVGGFRGGTIIALTNFVIVKQSDAHTWVEIWQDDKGWRRVEPMDVILPPEKKTEARQEEKSKEPAAGVQVKQEQGDQPPKVKEQPVKSNALVPAALGGEQSWKLPSWSSLFGNLQKWVIHYDPDRQMDLLKGVGIEESNWLDLLISGVVGVAAMLGVYLIAAWRLGRTKLDRLAATWLKFCRRLEKLGVKKTAQECPRNFLNRVRRERPELAAATEDIIVRYIDIRYGENDSPEAFTLFKRQVERFISMT
jgi:transglutaminase-like putative cysteine protease